MSAGTESVHMASECEQEVTQSGRPLSSISQAKIVREDYEVNRYLNKKWTLLFIGQFSAQVGPGVISSWTQYTLGWAHGGKGEE